VDVAFIEDVARAVIAGRVIETFGELHADLVPLGDPPLEL